MTLHGLRLRMVHGHLLGRRRAWKAWMESRAFFEASRTCPVRSPGPSIKSWRGATSRGLDADEERHLRVYRNYAAQLRGSADIVVIRPCPPPGRPGSRRTLG